MTGTDVQDSLLVGVINGPENLMYRYVLSSCFVDEIKGRLYFTGTCTFG